MLVKHGVDMVDKCLVRIEKLLKRSSITSAKKEDIIIGVLSALPNNCADFLLKKSYQLRGIAINYEFQRKGIGSLLVQKVEQQIRLNKSIEYIWLNARVNSKNFYLNLGYIPLGKVFNLKDIGMHQRYIKNNS